MNFNSSPFATFIKYNPKNGIFEITTPLLKIIRSSASFSDFVSSNITHTCPFIASTFKMVPSVAEYVSKLVSGGSVEIGGGIAPVMNEFVRGLLPTSPINPLPPPPLQDIRMKHSSTEVINKRPSENFFFISPPPVYQRRRKILKKLNLTPMDPKTSYPCNENLLSGIPNSVTSTSVV